VSKKAAAAAVALTPPCAAGEVPFLEAAVPDDTDRRDGRLGRRCGEPEFLQP